MWTVILATIVITALLVVVSMNFHRPEKSVQHHVEHGHAIDARQFQLKMDASIGGEISPPFCSAVREADLRQAKPYTLELWQRRPWWQKVRELLLRPLSRRCKLRFA